ncbi:MAG: decarboxylase [Candidatus Nanoarchaeia archaeon]|nr:decarboxylase [Candidatus Nanoarchaeia archaeon]
MAKFVLYKDRVVEQFNSLRELDVDIAYIEKANPLMVPILEENTRCEFNIDSLRNLKLVKDMSRVWYHSQLLSKEDLEIVLNLGIRKFVIEDLVDLNLLLNYVQDKDYQIDLMLRMKLKENTIFTGRYFVFGMDSDIVNSKIKELRENKKIRKLGIHFHRKSQNVSEWSLKEELKDSIEEEVLNLIDFIDIGGGLPTNYKNSRAEVLNTIFPKIKKLVEWLKQYNVRVMIEPGRYLSGPCVELEAEIKKVSGRDIVIDCSVYNSCMDTLIAPIKLIVKNELDKNGKSYVIKGCTPCSFDIFRYDVKLDNPRVGDKLVFINAGAYNFYTDFCNLDKVETIIV